MTHPIQLIKGYGLPSGAGRAYQGYGAACCGGQPRLYGRYGGYVESSGDPSANPLLYATLPDPQYGDGDPQFTTLYGVGDVTYSDDSTVGQTIVVDQGGWSFTQIALAVGGLFLANRLLR